MPYCQLNHVSAVFCVQEIPWSLKWKLVLQISLSIHTATSCMCVLCVINSLQVKALWPFIKNVTLKRTVIRVLSARNVIYLRTPCISIWIFIPANTGAQNVANAVTAAITWRYTGEVIQLRSRLNVVSVANGLQTMQNSFGTAELTVEWSRTNVSCVTRRLVGRNLWTFTRESTRERNRTSVTCVAKHLVSREHCTITCANTPEINRTGVHCVTGVSATPATCRCISAEPTLAPGQLRANTIIFTLKEIIV